MTSISPAAQAALDEYLEGLRRRALAEAVQIAEERDEEVVTAELVLEVVRALPDLTGRSKKGLTTSMPAPSRQLVRRNQMLQRLALAYVAVGISALVTGGLSEYVRRHGHVTAPVVLAVAGVLAVLLGALVGFYGNTSSRQRELALAESYDDGRHSSPIQEAWAKFERVLRTEDSTTLSEALRLQQDRGALTDSDLAEVRDILRLRNDVVHGGVQHPPQEEEAAAARLDELTRRLEKRPVDLRDAAIGRQHP